MIQENTSVGSVHWMGKVNFVEIRSFWHIFRSFDRMWIFLILSLQVSRSFLSTSTLLQFFTSLSLLGIVNLSSLQFPIFLMVFGFNIGHDYTCLEWWHTKRYLWCRSVYAGFEHIYYCCSFEVGSRYLVLNPSFLPRPFFIFFNAHHRFFARELSSCRRTLICQSN